MGDPLQLQQVVTYDSFLVTYNRSRRTGHLQPTGNGGSTTGHVEQQVGTYYSTRTRASFKDFQYVYDSQEVNHL